MLHSAAEPLFRALFVLLLASTQWCGKARADAMDESLKTRLGNHTIDRTVQLRTHSIYAPYIDQDLQNRWWDFGADSYVNTNKHIRLTRNKPSQMGWLWSRLPLTATNYVIEVEFKVTGDSHHLFGDGLAIWLTTGRAQPGPVFGNTDNFEGLGLFLDTYANARHTYSFPRITAMLGDGRTQYNQGDDGESQSIGACSANFRRTNVATKMRITYLKDTFLDVKIQYRAWDEWTHCFNVRDIKLPAAPFLGFSAMTGDVSDAHDIISITTYSAVLSKADNPPNKIKSSLLPAGSGTWFGSFVKFALFVGVCFGLFYGYQQYRIRKGGRGGGFGGGFGDGFGDGMRRMGRGGGFGGIYQNGRRFD